VSAALPIAMVAKPWGMDVLPPPFLAPTGERIGEVWFEPPPELPGLLVKYLFTSEKLSVQVHPSDAQAEAAGLGRAGKEECWLVSAAEPGATLGVGFRESLSAEAMRAAALDGSIEDLLVWHPVSPGDFFYIPAGTVHAIGAGVSLIEVQQTSDITYRLYDYGRPRELHLDAGLAVAKGEVHPPKLRRKLVASGAMQLVDGPLFRLYRIDGMPSAAVAERYAGKPLLAIPLSAAIEVTGESIQPGGCALVKQLADLTVPSETMCLIAQDCA
jgi:mannose-6-phosphate isomerase